MEQTACKETVLGRQASFIPAIPVESFLGGSVGAELSQKPACYSANKFLCVLITASGRESVAHKACVPKACFISSDAWGRFSCHPTLSGCQETVFLTYEPPEDSGTQAPMLPPVHLAAGNMASHMDLSSPAMPGALAPISLPHYRLLSQNLPWQALPKCCIRLSCAMPALAGHERGGEQKLKWPVRDSLHSMWRCPGDTREGRVWEVQASSSWVGLPWSMSHQWEKLFFYEG